MTMQKRTFSHGIYSPVTAFSLHVYEDFTTRRQREKASIKTPLVVRQGNDILVVTDLEKVLYDDVVN